MANATNFKLSPVDTDKRRKLGLKSGMTVRVWQKIQEKGKTRLQAYEGLVIAVKHGTEPGATFTVRKVASGVGMEKIYPLYSPNIDKIEILKQAKTRRSKLYFIREKAAREIRRRMKRISGKVEELADEEAIIEQEAKAVEEAEKVIEAEVQN